MEDLQRGFSFPRNGLLFDNAIYLLPYTGIGSGVLRALQYDSQIDFVNDSKLHDFLVSFKRVHAPIDEYGKSNHQDGEVTIKSNHQDSEVPEKNVAIVLSKRQRQVIDFCTVPRSAQEIMDFLGISNQSKNRKRYIVTLLELGLLQMTNPNFVKDRNQKYKKI